jgi:copper(I)-binding protein
MTMKTLLALSLAFAALFCAALNANADVKVTSAWARATVAQQKVTGAFARIESTEATRLVAVNSPAAARVEIHEMSMADGVMKMREVDAIAVPAGQALELKPGGFHLMLMDLKKPVAAGEAVPLSFVFEDKAGKRRTVEVKAEARALGK